MKFLEVRILTKLTIFFISYTTSTSYQTNVKSKTKHIFQYAFDKLSIALVEFQNRIKFAFHRDNQRLFMF